MLAAYKYTNARQSQLSESGSLGFYCLDSVFKIKDLFYFAK